MLFRENERSNFFGLNNKKEVVFSPKKKLNPSWLDGKKKISAKM